MSTDQIRAEVLVIGSGPGGATTAHLVAEHGKDVVILEEGRDLPLESCEPFSVAELEQKYRAGGLNPAFGRAKIAFVEGCVVGGGSEINSGLYHRTPLETLELWRDQFRVLKLTPEDVVPCFEYTEHALRVGKSPDPPPAAARKLCEGAERLGWRAIEVPRWFEFNEAPGPDGRHQGIRQSMSKTFIPRALTAGARLLPNTRALRLQRVGPEWTANATSRGKPIEIRAKDVFVCGGAVQTSLLLRRSGITRKVGNSLAMHPTVKVVAVFDEEVNDQHVGVPAHQVKELSPRIGFGCSISSLPHLALALADHAHFAQELRENWRRMAIYYCMITGPNTGRIRGVPGSSDPLIRYELGREDWMDLAGGMKQLCRLLLCARARKIYPVMQPATAITCLEQVERLPETLDPRRANLMTIHLFSSVPMGEDRSRCAVDSFGKVHEAPNLYVNDAGIIPTAPGVNPQGTVMALAGRNTLHYLNEF